MRRWSHTPDLLNPVAPILRPPALPVQQALLELGAGVRRDGVFQVTNTKM